MGRYLKMPIFQNKLPFQNYLFFNSQWSWSFFQYIFKVFFSDFITNYVTFLQLFVYLVVHLFFRSNSDSYGSEHTKSGTFFPLEVQLIHYKESMGSFKNALNDAEGLAILSSFFQVKKP